MMGSYFSLSCSYFSRLKLAMRCIPSLSDNGVDVYKRQVVSHIVEETPKCDHFLRLISPGQYTIGNIEN